MHSSSDVVERVYTWTRFKHTDISLHTFNMLLLSIQNILWLAINCGGGVGGFDPWPQKSRLFLALSASWVNQLLSFGCRDFLFFFLFPSMALKGYECWHFLLYMNQPVAKGGTKGRRKSTGFQEGLAGWILANMTAYLILKSVICPVFFVSQPFSTEQWPLSATESMVQIFDDPYQQLQFSVVYISVIPYQSSLVNDETYNWKCQVKTISA